MNTVNNHHKHYKHYKPSDTLFIMSIKNILWGSLGLIIGILINDTVIFLANYFKIKSLFLQNVIQITFCSIILAFMHTYHKFIGWTLQSTLPGLFFLAFLFGVQFKILNNIENSYILSDKV